MKKISLIHFSKGIGFGLRMGKELFCLARGLVERLSRNKVTSLWFFSKMSRL